MCAFRETFSRPVQRIQFLGLFDTVNSVPRFENAWMQRSKFPYTARSTAKVIRHAVAIDERRAKFRQDLISETREYKPQYYRGQHKRKHHRHGHHSLTSAEEKEIVEAEENNRGRKPSTVEVDQNALHHNALQVPSPFRHQSEVSGFRNLSTSQSRSRERKSVESASQISLAPVHYHDEDASDGESEQDIQEVWFAGCHAVSLNC
jgi:uncharacterized protein (DUF2235 family)